MFKLNKNASMGEINIKNDHNLNSSVISDEVDKTSHKFFPKKNVYRLEPVVANNKSRNGNMFTLK